MIFRRPHTDLALLVVAFLTAALAGAAGGGDASASCDGSWTRFRGPRMDGRYCDEGVLLEWGAEGPPLLWKHGVGGGHASFVVADDRAFTIEQRGEEEVVVAYDLWSGEERWTHGWKARFRELVGGEGPRATPTWDAGRLYALGAAGELRALEASSGALLWRRNILADNGAENVLYGMAASPLVVGERVVVQPGGGHGASVVAYDKESGERLWATLDDRQAYTSPMLVTLGGVPQILTVSAEHVLGLALDDGALLWSYPWTTQDDVNAAQPLLVGDDRIFVSAGYDHGAALLEIRRTDDGFRVEPVWVNRSMRNRFSSSVLHDGYVYGLDETILACVEVETGERCWKDGRYGRGGLLGVDDRLIVLGEGGQLALVRASPTGYEELAELRALQGKTWNSPALAQGILLVRNTRQAAAYDLRLER